LRGTKAQPTARRKATGKRIKKNFRTLHGGKGRHGRGRCGQDLAKEASREKKGSEKKRTVPKKSYEERRSKGGGRSPQE